MATNELIHETSPYLLQHAHNPVDWMPWGASAFEKARREKKPVFLSVGYSTCHWCHVMAHESFEDEEVANILNENFISIKVDREELPDVDEQYMLASQVITRRGGGWPNSVWLTADKKPWFAGTYFPREDRGMMPGFKSVLLHLAETWKMQRLQVEKMADQMADILCLVGTRPDTPLDEQELEPALVESVLRSLLASYDEQFGGFGDRPKFPAHGTLSLLNYQYRRTGDTDYLAMMTKTLEAMCHGGIHDQIGGGFHRYSVDERWLLPHFEKMLYDNAQLIRAYADGYELTGREEFRTVVRETVAWLKREMLCPGGGFYSALDADSLNESGRPEEGYFYVWTPRQVIDVLGETDGKLFNTVYGITEEGNFEEEATGRRTGASIPFLTVPLDDVALGTKMHKDEVYHRLKAMRQTLLVERDKRPRPHRDDKVLTDWNGLTIGALAYAGNVLDKPEYVEMAACAATFVLENLRDDEGRLLRTWRDGRAKLPAYLNDYAFFIDGLLELHRATDEPDLKWLETAVSLADQMVAGFHDAEHGGFFMTSDQHDPLLLRSTGMIGGGNVPSGNAVAARVLTHLTALTGNQSYADAARSVFISYGETMKDQPHQSEHLALALGEYLDYCSVGVE